MIVYTHHSFVDKPPASLKASKPEVSKAPPSPKPKKVKARKPRDPDAERAKRRAYYHKHKGEIKLRRLRKELSK